MKWTLASALLLVALLAGCVSTKANQIQTDAGAFNKKTLEDISGYSQTQALELAEIARDAKIEALAAHDAKLQEVATTREKALADRDGYWLRVFAAREWYNQEVAKAKGYKAATLEAAKGFDDQARMTAKAGEIPNALAKDALTAAVDAAVSIYGNLAPSGSTTTAPTQAPATNP